MAREHLHIALCRFGMGAGSGDAAAAGSDPRGWLLGQLVAPHRPPALAALPPGSSLLLAALAARTGKDEQRKGQDRLVYRAEATTRCRAGAASPTPLIERLVRFWSNHFTVSVLRPTVLPLAGAFEREAIRPHVTGRFLDLLRAAVRHPAMLTYLDNAQSIGPNSSAGRRRGKGLNENLARELLELHTLGVDGGYGQDDVENLARILTGWSIDPASGTFRFAPRLHEPGGKTLLDRAIPEGGEDEGEAALAQLAAHPATARVVATKLARHFVADEPPPALVAALAATFLDTGGDLAALARLLVTRNEAWLDPLPKVRSPDDLVIAALKVTGQNEAGLDQRLFRSLGILGQAPWTAPSPAGWPDRGDAWIAPEAMMRRLEWARAVSQASGRRFTAALAEPMIGAVAGPALRRALGNAGTGAEALFLTLASREFQRR
ncbi:MAG: DUF1800 domain-containing protein [Magnetospirillum sp.]|nr:DUF1800 domain-containing protein [Magnetospirillum sp.]